MKYLISQLRNDLCRYWNNQNIARTQCAEATEEEEKYQMGGDNDGIITVPTPPKKAQSRDLDGGYIMKMRLPFLHSRQVDKTQK